MALEWLANDTMGKNHGKYDMDRVGLFAEMPYMIKEKYRQIDVNKGTRDLKNSQMYPSILKTKTGLQDAYFDPKYKRLFEKLNPEKPKSQIKLPINSEGSTKPPYLPSSYTKRHATIGDYYGTFGPKYPAMSNRKKPVPKIDKTPANIFTKPTNTRGPGWTDRGLSPFPKYMPAGYGDPVKKIKTNQRKEKTIPFINVIGPRNFFTKNPYFNKDDEPTYNITYKEKFQGIPFIPPSLSKKRDNCFNNFPIHMADPYRPGTKREKVDKNAVKNIFYAQSRNKTFYTVSTIQRKLRSALNNTTWEKLTPLTFK